MQLCSSSLDAEQPFGSSGARDGQPRLGLPERADMYDRPLRPRPSMLQLCSATQEAEEPFSFERQAQDAAGPPPSMPEEAEAPTTPASAQSTPTELNHGDARPADSLRPPAIQTEQSSHEGTGRDFHDKLDPVSTLPRELFRQLDADGNGFIDFGELKKLCAVLGNDSIRTRYLFDQMLAQEAKDPRSKAPADQASLKAFMEGLNSELGVIRRENRPGVKEIFEKLEKANGETHGIDKEQFAKLHKRTRKHLFLLPPSFDLESDWKAMLQGSNETSSEQTDEQTHVSFDKFERWWKARMGLFESDIPVIPEYISYQLEHMRHHSRSAQKRNKHAAKRSGKELWSFLRPRLRMLATMSTDWGHLGDVYGQTKSMFEEIPLPPGIIDPESNVMVLWDVMSLLLLFYVALLVPFRSCFSVEIELWSIGWFFDAFVDIFFLVDIIVNLRLAYYDERGVRESNPKRVALHYLRGWFALDLIAAIPVQHIVALASSADDDVQGSKDSRLLKTLRLVRMTRMLRVAKVKRMLRKYENSYVIQQYISYVVLFLSIVFTAHFLACFWFLVGTYSEGPLDGWVEREAKGDMGSPSKPGFNVTCGGDKGGAPECRPDGTRYTTSMYYVFNPVENADTDVERIYAILAYLLLVLIDGSVAGLISASLVGMNGADREVADRMRSVRAWMHDKRVPRTTQAKALQYFSKFYKAKLVYDEEQIFKEMPPAMRNEFSRHLYAKYISSVPMFRGVSQEIITALCGALEVAHGVKGQDILKQGSAGKELHMLIHGEVEVIQNGERLGFLSEGAFFGEVPLLCNSTGAEIRTRDIRACTDCVICYLPTEKIQKLMEQYPELQVRIKRAGHFGTTSRVNKKGSEFKKIQAEARTPRAPPSAVQTSGQSKEIAVDSRRESSLLRSGTATAELGGGDAAVLASKVNALGEQLDLLSRQQKQQFDLLLSMVRDIKSASVDSRAQAVR